MKNKKIIFIVITILIIIFITIFFIMYYKNNKSGNTMINKSEEEIINSILEMKSYKAQLEITIESNKNTSKYKVNQILENGYAKQEIIEPQNIAGVVTEYDGTNLKISNTKLTLETTFENYKYIADNSLWLDSFIREYKESKNVKSSSNENEIILEVKRQDSTYNTYKKLYINKKTGKIEKMIVQDINQKTLVYILYTEIKIS